MDYILTRKRGMKNIRIRISDEGNVLVSAPYYVSKRDIDFFVSEKAAWIKENVAKRIKENSENKIDDCLIFLGKERKLHFEKGKSGDYKIADDSIVLFTDGDLDEQTKKSLIYSFLGSEGVKLFPDLLNKYLKKLGYDGKPFSVSIKLLKSQWGNCNLKSRRFTFNILLLKLPLEFVEYTVAHEVTHLYIKGHGKDFYAKGESIYDGFYTTDRLMNRIKNVNIFD